jgi:thiol-disulfide isomerase/thioredoxin
MVTKTHQRLLAILGTFVVCIMIFVSVSTSAVGAATPTPTGERYSIVRPTNTPDEREPVVQTAAALSDSYSATMNALPTSTPGPSTIKLTGKPHFVEFYATWCGPCQAMKYDLGRIERKYGEDVTFWRIDIDNIGSDALNRKYRVSFIPYMVLLDKDGKSVGVLEGYQTEKQLDAAVHKLIDQESGGEGDNGSEPTPKPTKRSVKTAGNADGGVDVLSRITR